MTQTTDNLDIDPSETQEWVEALDYLLEHDDGARAQFIIESLQTALRRAGVNLPYRATTEYINTIPTADEPVYPGDVAMEARIDAYLRWNAMAMVVKAGKRAEDVGGHIASFASSATLYEVGWEHFFHSPSAEHGGDLVFMQGHSSPGLYALSYLLGRLTEEHLINFRQEVAGQGISSYPHPWLMPDFWQFPTVSMGLGPLQGIYQARFLKYLGHRGLQKTDGRHVFVFCGDGEMDEPESLGALNIAMKEQLDNLIFVINCNLQRLDGPVRGNGKVIQDLEGIFRGAGWNVIKVIWDHQWDALLAKDTAGALRALMLSTVDGDFQNFKAKDGAYMREHFFAKDPNVLAMVADLSDADLEALLYGGHDAKRVFAAYQWAVDNRNAKPTVILAHTVKGYGMGKVGQGQNTTHQQKKLADNEIREFRDRWQIPIADSDLPHIPFVRFSEDSPEYQYLVKCRQNLGGAFPIRRSHASVNLPTPSHEDFESFYESSGDRELSTTMAFVRVLNHLMKDPALKDHIVPIVPDECRTFGMEGMFRQYGIYSAVGQLYTPVDAGQLMYYKEATNGQLLEEGITEAGAFSSWIAAATSYSVNDLPMIPFYIYYSMFGHQRIADLAWAAGDCRARGFLMGGTAGRTTLAGEGLQHQDGHSLVFANVVPNCLSYDPTFMYELAVIIREGIHRMYTLQEDIYYYITLMNENYAHPKMPKGAEEGIIKGMYKLTASKHKHKKHAQLLGSGTILREVMKAAEILEQDYAVNVDVWSVTSFNELTREAAALDRAQRLHPDKPEKISHVAHCLTKTQGVIVAATDYIRAYAEQIRAFIPGKHYTVLGTDGYGRSDQRSALRDFFEVDAKAIVYHTLATMHQAGDFALADLLKARKALGINPDKPNPITV